MATPAKAKQLDIRAPKINYRIVFTEHNADGKQTAEEPGEWQLLCEADFDNLREVIAAALEQVKAATVASRNGNG